MNSHNKTKLTAVKDMSCANLIKDIVVCVCWNNLKYFLPHVSLLWCFRYERQVRTAPAAQRPPFYTRNPAGFSRDYCNSFICIYAREYSKEKLPLTKIWVLRALDLTYHAFQNWQQTAFDSCHTQPTCWIWTQFF